MQIWPGWIWVSQFVSVSVSPALPPPSLSVYVCMYVCVSVCVVEKEALEEMSETTFLQISGDENLGKYFSSISSFVYVEIVQLFSFSGFMDISLSIKNINFQTKTMFALTMICSLKSEKFRTVVDLRER